MSSILTPSQVQDSLDCMCKTHGMVVYPSLGGYAIGLDTTTTSWLDWNFPVSDKVGWVNNLPDCLLWIEGFIAFKLLSGGTPSSKKVTRKRSRGSKIVSSLQSSLPVSNSVVPTSSVGIVFVDVSHIDTESLSDYDSESSYVDLSPVCQVTCDESSCVDLLD